jgi:hypothetical protein
MKVKVKLKVVVDVTTILVDTYVRYWEDTDVNGQPDDGDTPKMPCVVKSADNGSYYWKPIINIETGQILNWQQGVTAKVHYKVCDEFACTVIGQIIGVTNLIKDYEGYVPDFMCPSGEPDGDYIIMDIDGRGYIKDWCSADVVKFVEREE